MKAIDTKPHPLRIWFVALRPFSFTASILPVILGSLLAVYAGYEFSLARFCVLLLAVVSVHAAANLLNDAFDYARGVDRQVHPVSGAVVRGWLSEKQVRRAAYCLLILGVGCCAWLILRTGWGMAGLMLAGLVLALGYTRSGICLKYLGLGDLTIFLAFGVLPVLAGWWVQTTTFSWVPFWLSFPSGLLSVAILHANNWRDRLHDAEQGCRTFAVRIGSHGCRRYWQALLLLPMLLVAGGVLTHLAVARFTYMPVWTLSVFLVLPEWIKLVRVDWSQHPDQMVALDARAARLHSGFTFLLCMGFLLAHWLSG